MKDQIARTIALGYIKEQGEVSLTKITDYVNACELADQMLSKLVDVIAPGFDFARIARDLEIRSRIIDKCYDALDKNVPRDLVGRVYDIRWP